jgi:peptidyl-prolyl cis-trans isomerase D
VTRDDLPGTLTEAAFGADKAGIVDPVETPLGWSLMNIRSIQAEQVTSFDDAKAALADEMNMIEARRRVPDMSISLDDQLAGGFSLKEAAEQSGSRYGEIEAVDETGRDADGNRIADLPEDREFLSQVFSTEANEDPYLIDGTNGDYFALIVEDITPATLRPIDTIREELVDAWEFAEREKALATLTGELAERLKNGDDVADIAEEYETEVKTAGPGTRTDRSLGLSADLLETVFSIEQGEAAEGLASNGLTRVVGIVTEIDAAASEEDVAAIDRSTEQYAARLAQDMVDQFSRSARERHPLIINPQAIEAVFSPQHGGMGY